MGSSQSFTDMTPPLTVPPANITTSHCPSHAVAAQDQTNTYLQATRGTACIPLPSVQPAQHKTHIQHKHKPAQHARWLQHAEQHH